MHTFLPYESFEESAACLDNRRLKTQCKDALECLYLITGMPLYTIKPTLSNSNKATGSASPTPNEKTPNWEHPCRKMWQGYAYYLSSYTITMCMELLDRDFDNPDISLVLEKTLELHSMLNLDEKRIIPPWLDKKVIYDNHKAFLIFKAPNVYSSDWPDISPSSFIYYPAQSVEVTKW